MHLLPTVNRCGVKLLALIRDGNGNRNLLFCHSSGKVAARAYCYCHSYKAAPKVTSDFYGSNPKRVPNNYQFNRNRNKSNTASDVKSNTDVRTIPLAHTLSRAQICIVYVWVTTTKSVMKIVFFFTPVNQYKHKCVHIDLR